jgi:hypothetical protein
VYPIVKLLLVMFYIRIKISYWGCRHLSSCFLNGFDVGSVVMVVVVSAEVDVGSAVVEVISSVVVGSTVVVVGSAFVVVGPSEVFVVEVV